VVGVDFDSDCDDNDDLGEEGGEVKL